MSRGFFMEHKNIFADNLKRLRKSRELTLIQLSNDIGLSKTSLNDIENAKVFISFDKAIALADYFNVSLDYLVGRDGQEPKPDALP